MLGSDVLKPGNINIHVYAASYTAPDRALTPYPSPLMPLLLLSAIAALRLAQEQVFVSALFPY